MTDRSPRLTVRRALSTLAVATAAPDVYTLSIWSCGALLVRSYGLPNGADVFTFVAGAVAGFNVLALFIADGLRRMVSIDRRRVRLVTGVLDWAALGVVVGGSWALADIRGSLAWLVVPFIATVCYVVIASFSWRHSPP